MRRAAIPALLFALPLFAQQAPTPYQRLEPLAAPARIPIQLAGALILVDGVRVNGEGPFRFMLDTGAMGGGRVDVSLATKLGLEQQGSVQGSDGSGRRGPQMARYTLERLEFGGLVYEGVDVISRDYNLHGAVARGHIDGILGIGLFENLLLTIDYPGRELRVESGELPAGTDVVTLLQGPIPALQLELGGETRTARIDTGNSGGLTVSQQIAGDLAFTAVPVEIGRARTVSGSFAIRAATLDGAVTVGGAVVERPEVVIAPMPDVNLGSRFLQEFKMTFDQRNRRARFEHTSSEPVEGAPSRTVLRAGVTVPMKLVMGRPVIDVAIGGERVPMIVDTGTGTLVLFPQLVAQLGLESTGTTRVGDPAEPQAREAKTYEVPALAIGDARFEGVPALSWDDDMSTSGVLGDVRGIVGAALFAENLLTLDFPANELVLSRGALGTHDGSVPFRFDQWVPTLDLVVGDEKLDLHVDTGNPGGLLMPDGIETKVAWASAPRVVGRARTASGTFEVRGGTLERPLTIAGQVIEGPVVLGDRFRWANVGSGLLQNYVLTIDQTNRRLRLAAPSR